MVSSGRREDYSFIASCVVRERHVTNSSQQLMLRKMWFTFERMHSTAVVRLLEVPTLSIKVFLMFLKWSNQFFFDHSFANYVFETQLGRVLWSTRH